MPTFGGPKIARRIPTRMISPRRLSAKTDCIISLNRRARRLAVHRSSINAQTIPRARREIDNHASRTYLPRTHPPHCNLLALSRIDEGLDKRETAHDILTQRNELFSCLTLQKSAALSKAQQRECDRSLAVYAYLVQGEGGSSARARIARR